MRPRLKGDDAPAARGADADADADADGRINPRRRAALIWCVVGILLAGAVAGGWALSKQFESPEQKDAAASAPKAEPISAQVSRGDLSDTTTVNADVARSTNQQIPLIGFGELSVVTGQPLPSGGQIDVGTLVTEVNGRPVLAFPGAFPLYRDLTVGDSGPDVRELQTGLREAGYHVQVDGVFGKSTAAAILGLYKTRGYSAPTKAADPPPDAADQTTGNGGPPTTGSGQAPAPVLVVPKSEIVVVSTLPAYFVSGPTVGTVLSDKDTLDVESGALVAAATVTADATTSLQKGMSVSLQSSDGDPLPATLSDVGAADKDGNARLLFAATNGTIPDAWLRQTVLATIIREVAAKDSLIVPTRAIITSGGSIAHVLKREKDGSFVTVRVKEIGALQGRSAVQPATPDELSDADFVKVG